MIGHKRILSLALFLLLAVQMLPTAASAQGVIPAVRAGMADIKQDAYYDDYLNPDIPGQDEKQDAYYEDDFKPDIPEYDEGMCLGILKK